MNREKENETEETIPEQCLIQVERDREGSKAANPSSIHFDPITAKRIQHEAHILTRRR